MKMSQKMQKKENKERGKKKRKLTIHQKRDNLSLLLAFHSKRNYKTAKCVNLRFAFFGVFLF